MNEKNKNVVAVVILVAAITIIASVFIDMSKGSKVIENSLIDVVDDDDGYSGLKEIDIDQILRDQGLIEEFIDSASIEEKEQLIMGGEYEFEKTKPILVSKNKDAIELPKEQSEKLWYEIVSLYGVANFDQVKVMVNETIKDYHLTEGLNSDIAAIYSDANYMISYSGMDLEDKEKVLKNHRSPSALAIDTLFAYVRRREAVILDFNSLSPIISGEVRVTSSNLLGKESTDWNTYAGLWEDVVNVYEVKLIVEKDIELTAYVLQNNEHDLRIAGYYGSPGLNYMPVSKWIEWGIDDGI